ncbi:MAG: hypothetical protein M1826_001577 [Phylliscum demangeonii]|nr:MAG: hypothetical protein M1826_001577 [Phylliscum demangeonii]
MDISLLLMSTDDNEKQSEAGDASSAAVAVLTRSASVPAATSGAPTTRTTPISTTSASTIATVSSATNRRLSPHPAETPAKKRLRWSPEEDGLIIHLRRCGMKWDEISEWTPRRSAAACRRRHLHHREQRSDWDKDRKDQLARLYEKFKAEMWSKVAEEMNLPWPAAETMHWQLGQHDMARRAGVTPFSLSQFGRVEVVDDGNGNGLGHEHGYADADADDGHDHHHFIDIDHIIQLDPEEWTDWHHSNGLHALDALTTERNPLQQSDLAYSSTTNTSSSPSSSRVG